MIKQYKETMYNTNHLLQSFDANYIKKKILACHSHSFLLPCTKVEEYFIISITFIFNLYFLCFVVHELQLLELLSAIF